MRNEPAKRRHRVATVVGDEQSPFELAVACEVFGIDRSEEVGAPWYRFLVCSATSRPVRAHTGFSIHTDHGVTALRRADTIVVPASGRVNDPPPELLEELRRAHRRGARLLSVCTGAFVLAHAGLLDGRRATTHWKHTDELARRFPQVRVDPNVLYVDDGDIMTSAGTAAGIDLCLHVVRLDFGAEAANIVARGMVVPPHRDGGQAQYINQPIPRVAVDDPFTSTLSWVRERLHESLSVAALAQQAAMSPRTFARRFRDVTGTTPHRWLLRQRIMLAQSLLECSDQPVEIIADRCGLGTAANLRMHFQRELRTSPTAYRRTFRAAAG